MSSTSKSSISSSQSLALCVIFLGFAPLAGLLYLPFRQDPLFLQELQTLTQQCKLGLATLSSSAGCADGQNNSSPRPREPLFHVISGAFVDILSFIHRGDNESWTAVRSSVVDLKVAPSPPTFPHKLLQIAVEYFEFLLKFSV